MTLVLDTGVLIAVDRGDRTFAALLKRERMAGRVPVTHGGCVGQAWRNGSRHANLARLLRSLDVVALDEELGRRAGVLLGRARSSDVVDAAVVLLALDGDEIATSDPDDLHHLCVAADLSVDLLHV